MLVMMIHMMIMMAIAMSLMMLIIIMKINMMRMKSNGALLLTVTKVNRTPRYFLSGCKIRGSSFGKLTMSRAFGDCCRTRMTREKIIGVSREQQSACSNCMVNNGQLVTFGQIFCW